jgi:hypothetical protein
LIDQIESHEYESSFASVIKPVLNAAADAVAEREVDVTTRTEDNSAIQTFLNK